MDQRLYIDGVLMDVDSSTEITLSIKSNLFNDISKIASNSSYTIKLPKTVHNCSAIKHADTISTADGYAYETHACRYFRDGVEIIKDGKAVVLTTADAIEVSVTWGIYPALSSLLTGSKALNTLSGDEVELYSHANVPANYSENLYIFYADLDFIYHEAESVTGWSYWWNVTSGDKSGGTPAGSGSGSSSGSGQLFNNNGGTIIPHPCVMVSYLLEKIEDQYGVSLHFDDESAALINQLFIPCITKEANDLTWQSYAARFIEYQEAGFINFQTTKQSNIMEAGIDEETYLSVSVDLDAVFELTASYTTTPTQAGEGEEYIEIYPFYMVMEVYNISGTKTASYQIGADTAQIIKTSALDGGAWSVTLNAKGKVTLTQNSVIRFKFLWSGEDSGESIYDYRFEGGSFSVTRDDEESVIEGAYFPVMQNLPAVKITDFIKFLAAITGTFPLQTLTDGAVNFVPYDTILNNLTKAADWSSRLVPSYSESKPQELSYTLDDWAQVNWYKWKEDEKTPADFDGKITVTNDTLETERTVLTFPFAASESGNLPLYEIDSEDSNKATYSKCEPRIFRLVDRNGLASGVFDLNMQEIIADKYALITKILNKTRQIKETVRLSDLEIQNFDETVPVYFKQYGAFFAVTEISTNSSGNATVKLVQIFND